MRPPQDDEVPVATIDDARPQGMPGCWPLVGHILLFHASMSINVAVAFGFLTALFYAFVPPWVIKFMLEKALGFPSFGAMVVALWSATMWMLHRLRTKRRKHGVDRLPPAAVALCLPMLLVWPMLASGEIVRIAAMEYALFRLQPDCHQTQSLWFSLHEWSDGFDHRQAHAWLVKDGKRWIWSYRHLAFVPDSRPWANGGRCS